MLPVRLRGSLVPSEPHTPVYMRIMGSTAFFPSSRAREYSSSSPHDSDTHPPALEAREQEGVLRQRRRGKGKE